MEDHFSEAVAEASGGFHAPAGNDQVELTLP
jgi:hypothetical protein